MNVCTQHDRFPFRQRLEKFRAFRLIRHKSCRIMSGQNGDVRQQESIAGIRIFFKRFIYKIHIRLHAVEINVKVSFVHDGKIGFPVFRDRLFQDLAHIGKHHGIERCVCAFPPDIMVPLDGIKGDLQFLLKDLQHIAERFFLQFSCSAVTLRQVSQLNGKICTRVTFFSGGFDEQRHIRFPDLQIACKFQLFVPGQLCCHTDILGIVVGIPENKDTVFFSADRSQAERNEGESKEFFQHFFIFLKNVLVLQNIFDYKPSSTFPSFQMAAAVSFSSLIALARLPCFSSVRASACAFL